MILKTTLYDYQNQAIDKLIGLRIGALYMEMGTGKTRTALEIINQRVNAGKIDRVIWLCPCSVKVNLKLDLAKHCDGWENIIVIDGIETLSSRVKAVSDLAEIVNRYKCMLVVDESNLVKNPFALRSRRIDMIAEKCLYRMILNGTPIARNEADLFNQWYILDWRVFGYKSYYSFAANHLQYDDRIPGKIVRTLNVKYLTEKLAPYSYQATKADILQLPRKVYFDRVFHMTAEQDGIYEQLSETYLVQVDEFRPETIYRLFGVLQHCLSGIEIVSGDKETYKRKMFEAPADNPRIAALMDTLRNDIGDEKTIIFCKYTHEIEDIAKLLGDKAVVFYGELPQKKRQESIVKFKGDAQFFIANKTCGCYGLNLQFCRNMIFYSNDWDYATRSQAEDRIHRIGQTHEVNIYDIYCAGSLDNKIHRCLTRKENLSDNFKAGLKDKSAMKDWLRGKDGKDISK
jgi:SNF2 family DNA or RNA helicase